VRGQEEDDRSNDNAKNPEEGIDCELATTEFFTLSIWSGTQFICWPSVTVERSIAIFDQLSVRSRPDEISSESSSI
jgi:hypothetical protein